jgi:hypothetical protein
MIRRAAHRRVRAAAVAAYPRCRADRDAVLAAYRAWTATTAFGEPLAIEAYQSALDREERAADTYARLMSRGTASGGDRPRATNGVDAGAPGGVVAR